MRKIIINQNLTQTLPKHFDIPFLINFLSIHFIGILSLNHIFLAIKLSAALSNLSIATFNNLGDTC